MRRLRSVILGNKKLGNRDVGQHDVGQQDIGEQDIGQQDAGHRELVRLSLIELPLQSSECSPESPLEWQLRNTKERKSEREKVKIFSHPTGFLSLLTSIQGWVRHCALRWQWKMICEFAATKWSTHLKKTADRVSRVKMRMTCQILKILRQPTREHRWSLLKK